MHISQFRVVLRAKSFDSTCHFYGEVMALPRLQSWDSEEGRGALFHAGSGVIQVLGRSSDESESETDERYVYQGPQHKMTITLIVPSAEEAYEQLIFREKNIPGGLKKEDDGALVFETHDPDGVKIVYREPESRSEANIPTQAIEV